jgi:hypothetical protein
MCKHQEHQWRESHAYFAGYDDGLAGDETLRDTWSDWPEAYEAGYQSGLRYRAVRGA